MKIQTKVDVTYNVGVNGQQTGKVTGVIESCAWANEFTTVGVNFVYLTSEGAPILRDGYSINGEEQINGLYADIEENLTDLGSKVANTKQEFYAGFIYIMAQTFGISTEDIEIIM